MVGTMCGPGIWVQDGSCAWNMNRVVHRVTSFARNMSLNAFAVTILPRNIGHIFTLESECMKDGLENLKNSIEISDLYNTNSGPSTYTLSM